VSLNSVIGLKDSSQRKQTGSTSQSGASDKEGIKLDANDLAELEAEAQREGQINEMEAANDLKKAKSRQQLPASLMRVTAMSTAPVMSASMPTPQASALQKESCPPVPRLPVAEAGVQASATTGANVNSNSTDSLPSLTFGSPRATQSIPQQTQPQPQAQPQPQPQPQPQKQ